jgi:spore coat polysaccharide biosynthesis protein SpsF
MKIVAIIQARFASSRLPGKVLLPIAGQPMLGRVVERARRAVSIQEVVVATTVDPSDDAVAEMCRERGYACERGSLYDVLDRYYQAARAHQADVIVRITADCPLIDPQEIDRTVEAFRHTGADFAANRLPPPFKRTYPIGLDTEVCSFAALERAWTEAKEPYQREHVMPYLYNRSPVIDAKDFGGFPDGALFKVLYLNHEPDCGSLRWTVDTPEDLELIRRIYARLGDQDDFTWRDVLDLVEGEPDLMKINASVVHRTMNDVDERARK